jgi:hypothetical protein
MQVPVNGNRNGRAGPGDGIFDLIQETDARRKYRGRIRSFRWLQKRRLLRTTGNEEEKKI